jgi:5'-nucleotidase (lipoprotein e(P4) family)
MSNYSGSPGAPERSAHTRLAWWWQRAPIVAEGGLCCLLLAGCGSGNKSLEGLNATLWTQQSAEYRASAEQAYRTAGRMLDQGLGDPAWTAVLEQEGDPGRLPPAVILDVDETVLDNSPYQARLIVEGSEYPDGWDAWVRQAEAPPVPGALEFARHAAQKGVDIFYVTNRAAALEEATERNLERAGFPVAKDLDVLLMRGEREGWGSDKSSRRAYVASTHRILILAGDDLNDFISVSAASIEERDRLEAEYADRWGVMWIMLPNPAHGSWERALYGFDYELSSEQKRERKRESLNTGEGGPQQ